MHSHQGHYSCALPIILVLFSLATLITQLVLTIRTAKTKHLKATNHLHNITKHTNTALPLKIETNKLKHLCTENQHLEEAGAT